MATQLLFKQDFLTEDQIIVPSIIVIDFKDGESKPYLVAFKAIGTEVPATLLIGLTIKSILRSPDQLPIERKECKKIFISNQELHCNHKNVEGYRLLTNNEKEIIKLDFEDLLSNRNVLKDSISQTNYPILKAEVDKILLLLV